MDGRQGKSVGITRTGSSYMAHRTQKLIYTFSAKPQQSTQTKSEDQELFPTAHVEEMPP